MNQKDNVVLIEGVNAATACWSGISHLHAVERLVDGTFEDGLGQLSVDHVQLCPQNSGRLDEAALQELMDFAPKTKFRFHANVRIMPNGLSNMVDAKNFRSTIGQEYFKRLAELTNYLKPEAYSLHAGRRINSSLDKLTSNVLAIEDMLQVPVGVEGHYPQKDMWLIQDWKEYEWLLNSGLKYAIDFSHLNIVAEQSCIFDLGLTKELVSSEKCIEVHVSDNDGDSDSHRMLSRQVWWFDAMESVNANAVLFSEGHQIKFKQDKG